MEHYRLFIAAELPSQIKAEMISAQAQLQRAKLPVNWVAPGAMHLTLRFLGPTSAALIPDLERAMRDGLAPYTPIKLRLNAYTPIKLRLNGVGAFPNERRPTVVWAGVAGEVTMLQRAQAGIEAALDGLGIAPEPRAFHPHRHLAACGTPLVGSSNSSATQFEPCHRLGHWSGRSNVSCYSAANCTVMGRSIPKL
jgi:RNA 2',3'-cyclic 3'-phosphodiesterase